MPVSIGKRGLYLVSLPLLFHVGPEVKQEMIKLSENPVKLLKHTAVVNNQRFNSFYVFERRFSVLVYTFLTFYYFLLRKKEKKREI